MSLGGTQQPPKEDSLNVAVAKFVAVVIGAGLIGGGLAYFTHHRQQASATSANSATSAAPGPRGFGFGGPVAGEQHIQGTVTATTSNTVTVETQNGTFTYAVNATSEIVRDGQPASLSAIQVGDPVLVHVFPSASGEMLVERLFAGDLPRGDFGRPGPRFSDT